MSDLETLLPHNATDLELGLEQASAGIDKMHVLVSLLWDPDVCPVDLLPWLAWAFSVDDWQAAWGEDVKRDVVRASVDVHRHKGSVGSVKAALKAAGYGDAVIVEGTQTQPYDGRFDNDGSETHGDGVHWAEYQVILARPITFAQAEFLRGICAKVAPARCSLLALDYTEATNGYNGAIVYDGVYSHGVN